MTSIRTGLPGDFQSKLLCYYEDNRNALPRGHHIISLKVFGVDRRNFPSSE